MVEAGGPTGGDMSPAGEVGPAPAAEAALEAVATLAEEAAAGPPGEAGDVVPDAEPAPEELAAGETAPAAEGEAELETAPIKAKGQIEQLQQMGIPTSEILYFLALPNSTQGKESARKMMRRLEKMSDEEPQAALFITNLQHAMMQESLAETQALPNDHREKAGKLAQLETQMERNRQAHDKLCRENDSLAAQEVTVEGLIGQMFPEMMKGEHKQVLQDRPLQTAQRMLKNLQILKRNDRAEYDNYMFQMALRLNPDQTDDPKKMGTLTKKLSGQIDTAYNAHLLAESVPILKKVGAFMAVLAIFIAWSKMKQSANRRI